MRGRLGSFEGVIELLSHPDDRVSRIVSALVVGDSDDDPQTQREEDLRPCMEAASDADGRVVNLLSMSGKRPLEGRTPCTTSKMGVIGFTRTLATELADDGVTVNAVCPGSVAGERLDAVIESQAANQERSFEDVEAEFRDVSPMTNSSTRTMCPTRYWISVPSRRPG